LNVSGRFNNTLAICFCDSTHTVSAIVLTSEMRFSLSCHCIPSRLVATNAVTCNRSRSNWTSKTPYCCATSNKTDRRSISPSSPSPTGWSNWVTYGRESWMPKQTLQKHRQRLHREAKGRSLIFVVVRATTDGSIAF
jgi:hypothetical protein